LSVALFVAVLVGGTARTFGPLIGVALIALIPLPGVPLVALVHVPGRAAAVIPGIVLFVALFVRGTRAGNGPASAFVPPSRSVDRDPPNTRPGPHIEIRGLSKSFGGVNALTDLDLEMAGGTIHGVMGPNGSGKTTLLRILAGELAPDSGRIAFDGVDVTDLSVRARIELGVRRTPQSTSLFPDLTPAAHVLASRLPYRRSAGFFRSLLRTPASRRETDEMTQSIPTVLQPFGLVGKSDVPTGSLSFGDQRSLMVALAAQGNVILLDEPSAGLTVAEIRPLAAELRSLRDRGAALIVVEHNLRLLQKVANVISVLDGGRLIARGEPSRVYEDADVKRAYLGTKRAAI
jgi:ABC-type branched-subunit amino acid transport system ATPase component